MPFPINFILFMAHGVLRSNDHLVSYTARLYPLSYPFLTLFILVHVSGIQKVTVGLVKGVEKSKRLIFADFAIESALSFTQAQGAKA